jgi:glycosyltransferase involved in cell wall biosynthesis
MKKKISFWIFNYMPRWEAASKEVSFLMTELASSLDVNLASINMRNKKTAVFGKEKYFPLPYTLIGLPFVSHFASSFHINHLFASFSERLLIPRLAKLDNSVLTVTKDSGALNRLENNAKYLRRFKAVIVQSERHYEILRQVGLREDQLKLIYPGIDEKKYKKVSSPFKIFFASSPFSKHDLLSRGMFLMMNTAKRCPDVDFILAWRDKNLSDLEDLIRQFGVKNIKIQNGLIEDMDALYREIHAVILPGLAYHSYKPCPHSALESLSHGKPVLVSRPNSLASLIQRNRCGIVFEPEIESLVGAIKTLAGKYEDFQVNCQKTVRQNFSKQVFLKKYKEIYESLYYPLEI